MMNQYTMAQPGGAARTLTRPTSCVGALSPAGRHWIYAFSAADEKGRYFRHFVPLRASGRRGVSGDTTPKPEMCEHPSPYCGSGAEWCGQMFDMWHIQRVSADPTTEGNHHDPCDRIPRRMARCPQGAARQGACLDP